MEKREEKRREGLKGSLSGKMMRVYRGRRDKIKAIIK